MRIGSTIIDTNSMEVNELDMFIEELQRIRARKLKAEDLKKRMRDLIAEAKKSGFTFIDKDLGHIWLGDEFRLYDERS